MTASRLILASASPNRLALLHQLGLAPEVHAADLDETPLRGEKPKDMVLRLARLKAEHVARAHPGTFVIGADTTVALGRRSIGKAENEAEAIAILTLLSGRAHRVWGGIAVITPEGRVISRVIGTGVKFKRLSAVEIAAYVASGEWRGKAGAYGVQGKAAAFVASAVGSYTNIVGLSLYDTMNILHGNGFADDQKRA